MRVGPGEDYGVRFVYHRRHLPVRVLRIKENWRLVEDPDGVRGWMVINFLGTSAARRCGQGACRNAQWGQRECGPPVEDCAGRGGQAGQLRERLVPAECG
jgi:SH3-like domain-containing protein